MKSLDSKQCTAEVPGAVGWRLVQCSRKAWKDGFCKQHHPDSVRERQAKSYRRFDEKMKRQNLPFEQLKRRTEALRETLWVLRQIRALHEGELDQQELDRRVGKAIETAEEALSC